MSKIVTAVNAMISNDNMINNVVQGHMETEIFFKYGKKHLWSIIEEKGGSYHLNYYPGDQDLNRLASISQEEWFLADIKSVEYNSRILGTKEALDSFKELNSIVREKVYGMDIILDDIIGDGEF